MAFYILQLGCFNWRRQSEEAAVGLRVLYSQMLNYFLGLGLENVSKSCEMCILIADSERRFLLIRRTSARVWRTDARPHRNTETRADGGSAEGGSCRGQCGDVRDQGTYTTSPRVCVWWWTRNLTFSHCFMPSTHPTSTCCRRSKTQTRRAETIFIRT